ALRLSKDSDVSNVTGFVQRLDVLLHDLVRIQLANFCAHLRQNAFLADRCRARVLHVDGADDGRSRSRRWRLRPDNYGRKERTKRGDPNRNRPGAHPSTKTLHMLEAQPHATQTDEEHAAISEITPQSPRRDFHLNPAVPLSFDPQFPVRQTEPCGFIACARVLNEVFSPI